MSEARPARVPSDFGNAIAGLPIVVRAITAGMETTEVPGGFGWRTSDEADAVVIEAIQGFGPDGMHYARAAGTVLVALSGFALAEAKLAPAEQTAVTSVPHARVMHIDTASGPPVHVVSDDELGQAERAIIREAILEWIANEDPTVGENIAVDSLTDDIVAALAGE